MTAQAKASKEQAIRELDLLYSLKNKVLQRDPKLFHESLENHKFQPMRSIQQWINTYQQFDPISDSIFFPKIGTYEKHKKKLGVFSYKYGGWLTMLPSQAYPVSLIEHS